MISFSWALPFGTEIKVVGGFQLMLPAPSNMCKTGMSAHFGLFAHPAIGPTPVFS